MSKKLIYLLSFLLMLCLVNNATADLVAHWPMNEGSGDTAADIVGGHHGTLKGGVSWAGEGSPVNGDALSFDGYSDGVSHTTDPGTINWVSVEPFDVVGPGITMAAWIRPDGFDIGDARIVTKQKTWSSIDIWWMLSTYNPDGTGLRMRLKTDDGGADNGTTTLFNDTGYLQLGVWSHAAATYDGSKMRLYHNGVEINSTDKTGTIQTDPTAAVAIGNGPLGDPGGLQATFHGLIDDVRIYSRALTAEEVQRVMIDIPPGAASKPSPADEATDVPREVVLSWTPGEFAAPINGHKVYLSESFNDVNDGIGSITQDANSYAPAQRLDFNTIYYWRVDEVNAPPESTVFEGDVWSFTTEPIAYPIDGNNITATASSQAENRGPENTVNDSGLDVNDLHSTEPADMWLSGEEKEPNGAWIEYELDKAYKLHQMWVWNFNEAWEPTLGLGFKDVTIEYLTNGTDYTTLAGVPEFAQAPGTPDCEHNTTVDFGSVAAKHVRLTANSNWGDLDQYGLSEVRFFSIPVFARKPYPDSGATDVSIGTIDEPVDVTLGFRAGREADKHDVYFSSDWQAVADGNALVATVTETSYGPLSLDLDTTYYWKINEVNEVETTTTWQGDIWNFTTTPEFFIVDDFELYNDIHPDDPGSNRIFNTWIDGYYNPTINGSIVGYANPPFTEQTIVHAGLQSMPLLYDNSGPANYSEAALTLPAPRDWTKHGIGELSLWFRGNPASVGSFTEGPVGAYTMTATGDDIWNDADQFHYAYKRLTGVGSIEAKVLSVDNTDPWAKAGVMIRETLDPGSAHLMALVTPGQGVNLTYRSAAGDTSNSTGQQTGITAPHWVRLTRSGSTFMAYHSTDGTTWDTLGSGSIAMPSDVYIGLALTSHNVGETCMAEFSNVATTGTVTGQWQSQDIGITSNDVEQLYVAVEDSTGKSKVVNHPDPNAVQSGTYQEWNIDLKQVSDAGVNLASINKMYIGLGDRDAPKLGGGGTLYIDDIRLYPYSRQFITPVEPNQANLVGHWKFDGDTTDSSGNGHHGSEVGTPTYVSGVFGQAIEFDGSSYVDCGTDPAFDITNEITVAAWIKLDHVDDRQSIVNKEGNGVRGIGYGVSTGGTVAVQLYVQGWQAPEDKTDLESTASLQPDTWYHVAYTYEFVADGTSKTRLYIDGQEESRTDTTVGPLATNTEPLEIGRYYWSTGYSRWFDGLIDDVRICNQALSVAEIAWLAGRTEPFDKPF